jgi:hypothetical protein
MAVTYALKDMNVEAVEFTNLAAAIAFVGSKNIYDASQDKHSRVRPKAATYMLRTMRGAVEARIGDMLIKFPDGTFDVMTASAFDALFGTDAAPEEPVTLPPTVTMLGNNAVYVKGGVHAAEIPTTGYVVGDMYYNSYEASFMIIEAADPTVWGYADLYPAEGILYLIPDGSGGTEIYMYNASKYDMYKMFGIPTDLLLLAKNCVELYGMAVFLPETSGRTEGDLFFRTDEKKLYKFTSGAWVEYAFGLDLAKLYVLSSSVYTYNGITLLPIGKRETATYQGDSAAGEWGTLKLEFNALLAKLRESGLMATS